MTSGSQDSHDPQLEAELRAVAEARSRGLAGHPSPQELVDYSLRVLPVEEADALQEHLAFCRECSQVVLDLLAFSHPSAGAQAQTPVDLDREWNRLEARLEEEERNTVIRMPAYRDLSWPLAALLLLALGLLGWNLKLREDLGEAKRPRADIAMVNLAPEKSGAERGSEALTRVRVRPDQKRVLFLLNLGDLREFPDYRIELIDLASKGVLWAESGVPRNDDGTFVLEAPAAMLGKKVYEVRVLGQHNGKSVSLASYSFEVVQGGPFIRDR